MIHQIDTFTALPKFIKNTRLPAYFFQASALHVNHDSSHNHDITI